MKQKTNVTSLPKRESTKEKDDGITTKTMTPVEKELNADSVKVQLEEIRSKKRI